MTKTRVLSLIGAAAVAAALTTPAASDEFIGGLRQHELWGFMLAMLAVYGSGALTLDRLLSRRAHLQPAWE